METFLNFAASILAIILVVMVFGVLFGILIYACRHNYLVWNRKTQVNKLKDLQCSKTQDAESPNEPIRMRQGKDGIWWGGNGYQIKGKE